MKELTIKGIKEGTVIDHIPSERTFKVVEILKLEGVDTSVTVGTNMESSGMGRKGIVKVSRMKLTKDEIDKIALVAPDATVNLIADYKVKRKGKVEVPDVVKNIVKCGNPNCVSNHEEVERKFYVLKKKPLRIKCHYCERLFIEDEIVLV